MKNKLNTAVFLLALIAIIFVSSCTLTNQVKAAGGEEPTPTIIPVYGGSPTYGGASSYGTPVYGGGVIESKEGEVIIDKMVKNPSTGNFVDHLGPIDPKYRPLNIITFKVTVKNPGEKVVEKAEVVDSLPEFVDYMSGPGNYDQNSRRLTWTVENLNGGEARDFEIKARISHQSALPEDKSVVCNVNIVNARLGDTEDSDESQFCIEKEMVIPQVPEAGAPTILISLLGPALSMGFFLRKKARRTEI